MEKNKHTIVKGIAITRKNLIELIVVAILLALGVDLIAGYALTSAVNIPLVTILVGIFLCLGSVLYLAACLFGRRVESRTHEAFFIYNKKKNEIIHVPRYEFSEQLYIYTRGAFVENTALKVLWEKEPLKEFSPGQESGKRERNKSAQLISEAAEYIVLEELSTHLTDYFAAEKFKKEDLKEYGRGDVPEVLLTNRFLELFSRPMEDRPAFMDERDEGVAAKTGIEIVSVYGKGGVIYHRFDLVLPKKSIVRRIEGNQVEIETKKLKMSITIRFEGFNTVLPGGFSFQEYYIGIGDRQDIAIYKLNIDIKVLIKLGALFSRTGWEYYHWADSFLEKIEEDVSKDAFFERINWESVYTVLQCLEQTKGKEPKKKAR